jgi:putative tryptophan/tyrosine transport system substrate-binding protein
MRRRTFITLLSGAALTWRDTVRAQKSSIPVVAFLSGRTREGDNPYLPALWDALAKSGFTDGKTIIFAARWADGQYARVPALAGDLISQGATVIIVVGTAVDRAVQKTTSTIPVVFITADDPVAVGLVGSLNRPSGNITGVTMMSSTLRPKMVELLHTIVPNAKSFFMLANPNNSSIAMQVSETQAAAKSVGLKIKLLTAGSAAEIETAFATMSGENGVALLVASDPFFTDQHDHIVALAGQNSLPAIYPWREYSQAGGLISYGSSIVDAYRQAGLYAARILKGAMPADLPVMEPTKFELVINLKTAKSLGLTIPQRLLATADEVIE